MSTKPLPAWNEKLHELMQFFIENTPSKTFGRMLRNFFLLNVSELKAIPPGWEETVLHCIAMLQLLDDAEDEENK